MVSDKLINEPIHANGCYRYDEAAMLTKCSYDTIYRAVAAGALEASGSGNLRVILGEWLLAWVKNGMPTNRQAIG